MTTDRNSPVTDARTSIPRRADVCIEAVLDLVGVHARALHALLSVAECRWNEAVATACIECRDRPVLHLNPAFVDRWCRTPERLAALVLHEMLHVTLGHTRLFPRPTIAHNVAFDTVINRLLLGTLAEAGVAVDPYAELFTAFYPADAAPAFLLRPPPGWPAAPDWSASVALPAPLRAIHRRLYRGSPASDRHAREVTYGDILAAIRSAERQGSGTCLAEVPLLGAHGATPVECEALGGSRDANAMDASSGAMHTLQSLLAGRLPGLGGGLTRRWVHTADRSMPFERALRSWFRQGLRSGGTHTRSTRWQERPACVVHRHEDRRAMVRAHAAMAFGAPAPLWFQGTVMDRHPDPVEVLLYVDVSGSMDRALPRIRRTLRELWREITPRLHWFSTEVVTASRQELDHGRIPTTGGTAITAVLEHALRQSGRSRTRPPVFVLTDGHLEPVIPTVDRAVQAAGLSVSLGVIGDGPLVQPGGWMMAARRLPLG